MKFTSSLGWKFLLVQMVTIGLFATSAYIVWDGLDLVKQNLQKQESMETNLLDVAELLSLMKSEQAARSEYMAAQSAPALEQLREYSRRTEAAVHKVEPILSAKEQKPLAERLAAHVKEYASVAAPAAGSSVQQQPTADPAKMNAVWSARSELSASLEKWIADEKTNRGKGFTRTYAQLSGNSLVLLFSILVSSVVSLTLVILVSRNFRRNLHRVVHIADQIAGKNLSVPDMDHAEEDEIGQLSEAMNRMKFTLRQMMEHIAHASITVTKESAKLIGYTGMIGSGSSEISRTMHQLASGAESQAHASSELVERMKLFSDRITIVVREKEKSTSHSRAMLSMTETGSANMTDSIRKMNAIDSSIDQSLALVKGLDEKARNISEVVSVIRNIAGQTHMLALNAAIEAARAGEHGKGFHVVAHEVRKLSEQVASSITHISGIIEDIQTESNNAVFSLETGYSLVIDGKQLVQSTGETFSQLNEEIVHIGGQIEHMSESLDEVAGQTNMIYQFLENNTSIAQQTAAGVSEVSATAGQFNRSMEEVETSVGFLDQEAAKLHALINQFRT